MNDIVKQRFIEAETKAYKAFMPIAKRIKKIEYDKKWEIVPDPSDPLRKFTLERETGWFRIKLIIMSQDYYHRGVWDNSRTDWKFYIGIAGIYKDKTKFTPIQIKPRMLKNLLVHINNISLPEFYTDIDNYKQLRELDIQAEVKLQNNLKLLNINNSTLTTKDYNRQIAPLLAVDPKFSIQANSDGVEISGSISYERFAKIAKVCGWIK